MSEKRNYRSILIETLDHIEATVPVTHCESCLNAESQKILLWIHSVRKKYNLPREKKIDRPPENVV